MGNKMKSKWRRSLLAPLLCGVASCSQPSGDSAPSESSVLEEAKDENTAAVTGMKVERNVAGEFCAKVGSLKLRVDASEELAFFCKGTTPSSEMIKLRDALAAAEPKAPSPQLLQAEHDPDTGHSEFLLAWGFHVPLSLVVLRDKKLYEYIAQGMATESLTMQATSNLRPDDPLDGGLHIYSVDLGYDLLIRGPQGLELKSQRSTQYNLYQVQAGNEDLGLGVEHLVSSEGGGYSQSTMMNVSLGDGKGGTQVLTLLHFKIQNQGFPSTATKSIQEIARHLAETMYTGLAN